METVDIVGNNFAALYLAHKLIDENVHVRLFLDGGRSGGHFAGIKWSDDLFDIGMVFLEKPSDDDNQDTEFRRFVPTKRFDWLRYGKKLNLEIEHLFCPVIADPVKVFYKGVFWDDHLIANNLDVISQSQFSTPENFCTSDFVPHAKYKNNCEVFDEISFQVASIFNHGESIHNDLILPFLKKITQQDPVDLVAKFHRVLWLPLYWPETVKKALAQEVTGLKGYNFYKTSSGVIAEKIVEMGNKVNAARNISVFPNFISKAEWDEGHIKLETDGKEFKIEPNCIGLGLNRFCTLFGMSHFDVPDAEDLAVGFFLVNASTLPLKCFSGLNILDDEYKIYRISNQGKSNKTDQIKLSVEANLKVLQTNNRDKELVDIFANELSQIFGVDRSIFLNGKVIVAKSSLIPPTFLNVSTYEKKIREVSSLYGNAGLTGQLLGYNLTSLNDQLAQSLQIYFKIRSS